jgi:hypothetical protein
MLHCGEILLNFGGHVQLWILWWKMLSQIRPAFARERTFLWFALCVAGITVRVDRLGVTSIVRALGLKEDCYERLLSCFHSPAIKLDALAALWARLVIAFCEPYLLRENGRLIVLGDGIKVAKSGKKMPGSKKMYQASESNTKPEYIFGHSCQAIALVAGCLESFFAIPLVSRIHEGVIFSNRDKRTLPKKMATLLEGLCIKEPCYFVADAYYACKTTINELLKSGKDHLISRVKSNAVAYMPAQRPKCKKRGAPQKYGEKVKLRMLLADMDAMEAAQSPVYGEKNVRIHYQVKDLVWKPVGILVRFVAVVHPQRGKIILLCTDLSLTGIQIIKLYGVRFKIEVTFKQTLHTLGTFSYHFWMASMTPLRRASGNQYLHRKSEKYRNDVRRKLNAYHCHMQAGIIAHGLLQYLSMKCHAQVWRSFGSWIRTIREGVLPSEMVVAIAMRNTAPEFLADSSGCTILAEFIADKIDLGRAEGLRMVA